MGKELKYFIGCTINVYVDELKRLKSRRELMELIDRKLKFARENLIVDILKNYGEITDESDKFTTISDAKRD